MIKKRGIIIVLIIGVLFLIQNAESSWITKRLTWNSGASQNPSIAVGSNDYIHVVWIEDSPGNNEIYYKKSTDGGTTWSTQRLTWTPDSSGSPSIAVDSNDYIHVVWSESYIGGNSEVFYKKSTDGGTSWTTKRLTWNPDSSGNPRIAVDSNDHIHVVWSDNTPGVSEIFYKKSTDGGTTWTTRRLTWNANTSSLPDIAIDSSDHIHVVWTQLYSQDNDEIYYKKSTDGGTTWTTRRLTWNSSYSWEAQIATDTGNNIYVVWYDKSSGWWHIYLKISTDGGSTWTSKRLTWNTGRSETPVITTHSSGHIHIAWMDITPGNWEIYYKNSTDNGVSWSTERLTWNPGLSDSPDIAVDSNEYVHIVWEDSTPGNDEIYLKKGK